MVHPGDVARGGVAVGSTQQRRDRGNPAHLPAQGSPVTDSTRSIAPRSAGAVVDTHLMRAARTDLAPDATGTSLIARLRSRILGARRA